MCRLTEQFQVEILLGELVSNRFHREVLDGDIRTTGSSHGCYPRTASRKVWDEFASGTSTVAPSNAMVSS
jgi:hypothetical protein